MTGEMTIENVINRSCINLHMKGRDKKEVIEEMAEMFDRAGVLVDKAGYIKLCMKERVKVLLELEIRLRSLMERQLL